jgi:hypothetical protein
VRLESQAITLFFRIVFLISEEKGVYVFHWPVLLGRPRSLDLYDAPNRSGKSHDQAREPFQERHCISFRDDYIVLRSFVDKKAGAFLVDVPPVLADF